MAAIDFYIEAGGDFNIDTAGSGLGFYGSSGFGTSVAVNSYQDTTYVTDDDGDLQGPQANNVKWVHANSGQVDGATILGLQYIPNYQSTLNIRFTHSSEVQVQNTELRIYDRTSIDSGASGVLTKVAEIIHPSTSQVVQGSGDTSWYSPAGSSVTVPLADSPGTSGEYAAAGSVRPDTRHDWYAALSASPTSIGSKTNYALYVATEYL